jgi:uncharacterized membrane protein YsdA (DUF1294 family)
LFDKIAAKKKWSRIPEYFLHLMELFGGIFAIFILIYLIKHKNKKIKYYLISWIIGSIWIIILVLLSSR